MADLVYQDGHKVCSRGCNRLVYTEHTRWPGVCSDCVQPAIAQTQAITADLLAGKIDVEQHNRRIDAVTIDGAPAAADSAGDGADEGGNSGRGKR